MKVLGIIAEYNPFHNGHRYQIEELKHRVGADYCIIAMSGDFLQRGLPAICNKYERARMALLQGADLVLELPTLWATASAELFARGGVRLFEQTGVVTHLGFGAETDDLDALSALADLLKEEPEDYRLALSEHLSRGLSFPAARKKAIPSVLCNKITFSDEKLGEILDAPNNILAIEYLKALPKSIQPEVLKRKGAGYHETDLSSPFPSATALRGALLKNETDALQRGMPQTSYEILSAVSKANALLLPDDLSEALGYRLLSLKGQDFSVFSDCSTELSNAIQKKLPSYHGFTSFCEELKTKNYTYTRISRVLLHILLDIRTKDLLLAKEGNEIPYLRVLGFRRDASDLLHEIKKEAQSPLITKAADYTSYFNGKTCSMMELDLRAAEFYQQLLSIKKGVAPANDLNTPIVIL